MYQILTYSTTCCMWRVGKVSRCEEKMFLLLCPVEKKYTTDLLLCLFAVCQKTHTAKTLPCAKLKHTAKHGLAVCPIIAMHLWLPCFYWVTHDKSFAVCPKSCPRQRLRHTANMPFPVGSHGEVTTDETLLTSGDFVPVVLCGDGIECIDTMGKGSN